MARWSKAKEADPVGLGVMRSGGRVVGFSVPAEVGRGHGVAGVVGQHWARNLSEAEMHTVVTAMDELEEWIKKAVPPRQRASALHALDRARSEWSDLTRSCFPNGRRALRSAVSATTPSYWVRRYMENVRIACSPSLDYAGRGAFKNVRSAAESVDEAF